MRRILFVMAIIVGLLTIVGCAPKRTIYKFSTDPVTQSLGSIWSKPVFLYSHGWVLEEKTINQNGLIEVQQIPVLSGAILYLEKDSMSFLDINNSGIFSKTSIISKKTYNGGESLVIVSSKPSGQLLESKMLISNSTNQIIIKHQLAHNVFAVMVVDISDIFYVD